MARRFTKSQKIAASLLAGKEGEADHVVPYSKGGETTMENLQVLTRHQNRVKGASVFEARKWQAEFLRKWETREPEKPFMLIAIPGGGKTFAALEAARRWMIGAADRRIIIVVPSDTLREQWRAEANKFGLSLQTKEFSQDFKHGFEGCVTTYQYVASQRALFNGLCRSPVMVIFDEVHHCGDEAHFGRGIKDAFANAKERLLMSGTPWKTDGTEIPYVRYDGNGFAVADFSYDYPRALNENVVRFLVFNHSRGRIKNDLTGDVEELSKEISDKEAARRLRRILDPRGDYVAQMIRDADSKLEECRRTTPDAGALALCFDQMHAQQIAQKIREITGNDPAVIVSDEDKSNASVDEYRRGRREWLVAVRKVSEGTDIKRLQVLCYLTNTTSELFFRQAIGRVSRVRSDEFEEAFAYLPADPRLVRCAENIETAQVQALKEQLDRETRNAERDQEDFAADPYTTFHDGVDVVLIGNQRVPLADVAQMEQWSQATGIPVSKVLELRELMGSSQPTEAQPEPEPPPAKSKEERMDDLRRRIKRDIWKLSKVMEVEVWELHQNFKPQARMTEEELKQKHAWILDEYKRYR